MRLVLQRVSRAGVTVDGGETRTIGPGLVMLVGVCPADDEATARWMAKKAMELRIFPDDEERLNRSVLDIGGQVLVVSNFTLYADCKKGRRPSFGGAAGQPVAEPLYDCFVQAVRELAAEVQTGTFGGDMQVDIQNDGPVTIILDSAEIMPRH